MPNILDNEELYDSIVLGGVRSPGQVTLSGHDRKVVWDVKKGPGLDGATTTLKEIPPIEFTASFYLVRDALSAVDEFEEWESFHKLIDSTIAGAKPKALDIYHPDLAVHGIKSVVKAQVSGAIYDGKGGKTVVVKFQEYRPPKKKTGTPTGSKAKKPEDDPNAAAKAELARLTEQYKNTPWG